MHTTLNKTADTTLQSLYLLWQHSPDTMFVIQKKQQRYYLIDFNPAQQTAFPNRLTPGQALDEILPEDMYQVIRARYERCLESRQPMNYEEEGFNDDHWSTLLVPLLSSGGEVEYVAGVSRNISALKQAEQQLRKEMERAESLNARYEQLNAELENKVAERTQELEQLAVTDRLTGLFNRHKLDSELAEEITRAERYSRPFGVILLDIDDFKLINDRYGHLSGDQVLISMAALLKENTRLADLVGRWGGEEFLILCTETSLEGLLQLAEKLRKAIEAHAFSSVKEQTASFGVAVYQPGDTPETLISRADKALYLAKNRGRNGVAY